jgi:hypothetical protein
MITDELVKQIIKEQSLIIGETLSKERATNSGVVKFNSAKIDDVLIIEPNSGMVIEKLINSYSIMFGQASIEVCIDIIRKFPLDQVMQVLPDTLKASLNKK